MMPSEAVDDYLKAIYEIAGDDRRASTASLARKLSVAPASVTGMLQKLAERKPVSVEKTLGRNDPCHCGSGKKFKKCHGR